MASEIMSNAYKGLSKHTNYLNETSESIFLYARTHIKSALP